MCIQLLQLGCVFFPFFLHFNAKSYSGKCTQGCSELTCKCSITFIILVQRFMHANRFLNINDLET